MKKYILVLAFAALSASVEAWDGEGTIAAPYLIRNSADWAALAEAVSAGNVAQGTSFRLMGDINATAMVGTSSHHFKGSFDGGGHTITADITTTSGRAAPFGYIENATISHVKIDGTIKGGLHTAGLAGSVSGTGNVITDCHVSAQITTFPENGMMVVGGFVGNGSNLTVEGCLFDGELIAESTSQSSYGGAIMGWSPETSAGVTVKNCIENGTYSGITHAGFNYAANQSASTVPTTNCYSLAHRWGEVKHGYKLIYLSDSYPPQCTANATYTTTAIQALPQGLKLGETFYLGSGETITFESYDLPGGLVFMDYCFSVPEGNVTISGGNQTLTMPAEDVYMALNSDLKGDGDENNPYLIENAGDWLYFTYSFADKGTKGYHFLLTDDIDINTRAGYVLEGAGDLCFTGVFDGGGHTITAHLSGGDNTAPFYKLNGGTIKNLHVAGDITGGIHSAGLVAGIWGNGNTNLVENCRVSATITCSSTHAGGFVGHASSSTTTLRGCLFDGTITGSSLANAGYLVGWCATGGSGITLEDCAAYNQHVIGATGCKMDLVLDEKQTARCGSATNTYGGYDVGSPMMVVRNANPALRLTYALMGPAEPVRYPVSHLASYGVGLLFDDLFMVGRSETPHFSATADDGFTLIQLTASDATITGPNGGWYTLTPAATPNVITIDATIKSSGDFTGDGTEESPYLIGSTADWTKLFLDLATGENTYAGKVFRLTHDIDCGGISVGTDEHPFSGTFDGDGHTLTLNVGSEYNPSDVAKAPFYRVSEATFRHLHTAGKVCTSVQYTGGIISQVFGTKATKLYDCHSSMTIYSTISGDASNGGLVGAVSNCDSLVIERCSFMGNLHSSGGATNCGGFVGWSNVPVTIRESLFDPADLVWYNLVRTGQNFVRMADYSKLTMEDCYTTFNYEAENLTLALSDPQGTFVVDELYAPEGGSYEFVGEPDVTFNGRDYYKNGCWIRTALDASIPFNHWQDGMNGCFISDPWTRNGLHQLKDLKHKPSLGVWTSAIPEAETQRTFYGVTYRYLSRRDYHFYISDEDRIAKGWTFESDDSDANLIMYTAGDPSEITAVVGFSDNASDPQTRDEIKGVLIRNDLYRSLLYNHTHLGLIAPHAFQGCTNLEKLFFEDNDDNLGNARTPFDFLIDQGAFEDCPNFKELMLMQYTTEGNNHWTGLTPTTTTTSAQVFRVADDAFTGCPNLRISVRADHYQDYLSSAIWKKHQNRFIAYESTGADFTVKGVKYRWYRDVATEDNDGIKNDEAGKADMMTRLRLWNGMYQQFNAASLLSTKEDCNVYYTSVVGVDDDDIDSENGTMRIYNDPGSYYNYKTIVLGREAIAGNTHVKAIEFWQTNGRSENSYSDLKMVIPNGAFKGCTNLKELRLFYYVQDGKDCWMALGPKDVIPGDNIFGYADVTNDAEVQSMSEANWEAQQNLRHSDFKILVSTELYPDFKDDPNWQPYLAFLEPVDYSPSPRGEFSEGGLTYDYMTSPGGIMQASQVVSQDVSWWTAPRIAIEVAMLAYTIGSFASAQGVIQSTTTASSEAWDALLVAGQAVETQQGLVQAAETNAAAIAASWGKAGIPTLAKFAAENGAKVSMREIGQAAFNELLNLGVCSADGTLIASVEKLGQLSIGQLSLVHQAVFQAARKAAADATMRLATLEAEKQIAEKAWRTLAIKRLAAAALDIDNVGLKALRYAVNPASAATSTAGLIASKCWGGSGSYNADAMNKGMRENILSNIHQVGLVGGGYVITTPQKNLVYHTYIKRVADNVEDALIYAGFDNDNNSNTSNRTMTFLPATFQNKTSLKTVKFHDISGQSSNTGMAFLFTIPDEAFKGCTALTEFSTLLETDGNGTRALGPENFILAGDSIFAGRKCQAEVDSLTAIGKGAGLVPFHIVIDPLRKDDFLASESWKPLERFFTYASALPAEKYSEYGAKYAYAYEQNSIKKEHKESGHLIEHTLVVGPDDDFITAHQGAVKLCNDIGTYNNYQLDEVKAEAFKDNKNLRSVSFTDLYGFGAFGDCYTGLQMHIGDRAFQGCTNLADLDLLYMVTDGENHIEPMTPQMISIGKDVFKDSPARLKMMPQQVAWFEADDAWAAYKDRFMPCVVRLSDPGVKKALKDMAYYDPANTGTDPAYWDDYCDFARIGGAGFSWLDGKFTAQKDNIYSFADFRWFESVGLDYIGDWFRECTKLANIELPSTIKRIGEYAFMRCISLTEIVIPAAVTHIDKCAFDLCSRLNTIVVKGDVPATLGELAFDKHEGLKIYVPTDKLNDYVTRWSDYAAYIQPMSQYRINKKVRVDAPGQLASALGLTLIKENDKVRYIQGPYAKYDSLTVIGPLNGEDVAVLRHMMGADAYDSDFTDGQLRYLNLWDATLTQDNVNSYNGYGVDEYLEKDNWVGEYMFHNCNALESVVLPRTVTEIGENAFQEAFGLKRIAVGRNTTTYTRDLLQDLTGIEEVVFLTDAHASSESDDPWEAPIKQVYTLPTQLGDYLGDTNLTNRAQNVTSPFSSDELMWALADKGHFFPSEYLELESAEGIFNGNTTIKDLDEFYLFQNVRQLENTFAGMSSLETVTLPSSVEAIGRHAFDGCTSLKTIHVSSVEVKAADENSENTETSLQYITPTLADDAFCTLPSDFQILVPKEYCKLYRERWAQYADHINPAGANHAYEEMVTVTLTEPNTLAAALGLTATTKTSVGATWVNGLKGDYSRIYKLKVIGPISGGDLDVMRHLAGYCPWTSSRNYAGRLEYIDLYDANLVESSVGVAGYYKASTSFYMAENFQLYYVDANELPHHAFLRAYNLRTLILPRTCTAVNERALQECEGLETLVLGDDMTSFNWNALDDDAMLTRMYILANQKVNITTDLAIWNALCNNYNPTFDAFYVRPSLYQQYLEDDAYTGSSWQRTNNVSKGDFDDDETFCAFGAHAAATYDDLTEVYSVNGWFDNHTGVKDLTPLGFAAIDELRAADMQKLTQLERVALPVTLTTIDKDVFSQSPGLRYVDMLMLDADLTADVKTRGLADLGIDTQQTLVYLPKEYGETQETNVVVNSGTSLSARTFRLVDGKDYCVPYAFTAATVENTRSFATAGSLYTVCVPYELNVPAGATAYQLSERDGDQLVFTAVTGKLEAMQPYLIKTASANVTLGTDIQQQIPASGGNTFGKEKDAPGFTMRGTFDNLTNAEAYDLGAYLMQSDNRWYPAPANVPQAYVPAYRCYLLQNGGNTKAIGMKLVDDNPNAIETIRTVDANGDENVYDLSGRRIDTARSGNIYIQNGKKYIKK